MFRKFIYLVSFVLVLALVSNASATLLARYNFENNFNDTASGGVGGTLTGVGGVSASTAQKAIGSYSLALDGSDDLLEAADSGKLQPGTNYTITAWVQLDDVGVATANTIASKFCYGTGNAANWFWFENSSGSGSNLRMLNCDDGGWGGYYYKAWSPTVDTWYHVAVTVSGTASELYVDGVSIGTGTVESPAYASTTLFMIGAKRNDTDDGYDCPLGGYIDDVGVWDTALSSTSINHVKNYGVPEPATIALLGLGGLALLRRKR